MIRQKKEQESSGVPIITLHLRLMERAVPSGALAAVLASMYGCDCSFAGWMIVGISVVSLVTIPLVLYIFPRINSWSLLLEYFYR